MSTPRLHHFSPVFANARWASEQFDNRSICYYRDSRTGVVKKRPKGRRQWGRQRDLYQLEVELALGRDLETGVAPVYQALLSGESLNSQQRTLWAQYLFSQFVRTPTFMRYEAKGRELFSITDDPPHDRVGCPECGDLLLLTNRDWLIVVAHEDDSFIRTDNPVLLTGFPERPDTALFYPLSSRCCFVACSMPSDWKPLVPREPPPPSHAAWGLPKGNAYMLNFYLARSAENSAIVHPHHDRDVLDKMLSDVLAIQPQPPFLLHHPHEEEMPLAFESIRRLMSLADGRPHPRFTVPELEPTVLPREQSVGQQA